MTQQSREQTKRENKLIKAKRAVMRKQNKNEV